MLSARYYMTKSHPMVHDTLICSWQRATFVIAACSNGDQASTRELTAKTTTRVVCVLSGHQPLVQLIISRVLAAQQLCTSNPSHDVHSTECVDRAITTTMATSAHSAPRPRKGLQRVTIQHGSFMRAPHHRARVLHMMHMKNNPHQHGEQRCCVSDVNRVRSIHRPGTQATDTFKWCVRHI